MILQALVEHYETLAAQGRLDRPGWAKSKISFALEINGGGELTQTIPMKTEEPRGNKTVLVPRTFALPAPKKRAVGIDPNFLWDNSSYLLGVDSKGKPKRSQECFAACRQLHHQLLDSVDTPAAKALLAFFDRWDPSLASEHPALKADWEEIVSGGNLVFRCDGGFVQEDPMIRQAWQDHYDGAGEGPELVCLVTGKKGPAEAVHPSVKGVAGAQSSGAALISFNAPAFCSYGRKQSLNAPVSRHAAFAYTAALNYLLADREHLTRIGDTTVLFWAKNGGNAYQDLFAGFALGTTAPSYTAGDLVKMAKDLLRGNKVLYDETLLDPNMEFYILGLSPNAARLSVRFFLRNSFGGFLRNVQTHQDRLEIIRSAEDPYPTIPLWKLLDETVNQNSRDKSPAPNLAGETLRAVLTDTRYPAILLNGAVLRIRAEKKITRGRAAILKAYYLKNPHPDISKPEEVLTVSLNPNSTSIPYNLGRLFSVLEAIQSAANPDTNTTIKDKYFNSASATPSRVFPTLVNLAQKHLRKLEKGERIYYNRMLTQLLDQFEESYPDRMSLPQQGAFQLGYYHQTQARYQKKEEKENV